MLSSEIRLAIRRLRGAPGFTFFVVSILAIGIGGATAVFSVFYALLLQPLPFPGAERLVSVTGVVNRTPGAPTSFQDFRDWRQQSRSFAELAAMFYEQSVNLAGPGRPERIGILPVSGRFFQVF